jgi:peptidoglycan/xylan/chitin deacetylase (PgdA/CDA1 family)
MKHFFLFFLFISLLTLGQSQAVLAAPKTPQEIPILMFHYIRDYHNPRDPIGNNLSINPIEFAKMLDTIKKLGYTTITFKDIVKKNIPPKAIVLTFDDGYEDFYSAAFPQLLRRNMKAVSFVIVGALGTKNYMTLSQIKSLQRFGMEIGGHTWTHPDLRTLSKTRLDLELYSSKKYLEFILHQPIISFAYPSGRFDSSVVQEVIKNHYNYAVTTEPGEAILKDSFTLRRLRVSSGVNLASLLKMKI